LGIADHIGVLHFRQAAPARPEIYQYIFALKGKKPFYHSHSVCELMVGTSRRHLWCRQSSSDIFSIEAIRTSIQFIKTVFQHQGIIRHLRGYNQQKNLPGKMLVQTFHLPDGCNFGALCLQAVVTSGF